jgi:hypothetical protein
VRTENLPTEDRVVSRSVVLAVALALWIAAPLAAQAPNAPHAGYVYPAGGQQGTTVQVRVGGRFLDGAATALVSGRGVRGRVENIDKPLTQRQIADLREKAAGLQKSAKTPAERRALADIRMQIGESLRRNANPTISELAILSVTIDADAEPGPRQLRLRTSLGLTNPVVFVVGDLPEFRENEEKATANDRDLAITLPATVNGRLIPGDSDRAQFPIRQAPQYMPGDVDRFRFRATKGQDLVCIARARDLTPYLADAVPGWIQATLSLYDASGRQIAYEDDFRFQPDPVLHVRVPEDGEYVLEIKDALYRGREDFVYRISIGSLPFITSIFPLGGPAGAKTVVQVNGWNLPANRVTMDAAEATPGLYTVTTARTPLAANLVPFAVDTLPEVAEREPNDTREAAQHVTLPVIVDGRIQQAGDVDVFRFQGRAGGQVAAEILGRRLGSPLDSSLELLDPQGRRVAFNDDFEDKSAGLLTHHADSHLDATLTSDGVYALRVRDVQRMGGPEFGYRLRIGPPRPDFELRVSPADITAGAGNAVPVTITAIRRDLLDGDIQLALEDAPTGFALAGGTLPAGQDRIRVTLNVPQTVTAEPVGLKVVGRATVQGKPVARAAVPADDMMQAFAYRHLVPTDALRVSVIGRGATRPPVRVLGQQPVKIPLSGTGRVRVAFLMPRAFEKFGFDLDDPPEGIAIRQFTLAANGAELELQVDAAKVKPGLRGNLIVTVSGERIPQATQANTAPAGRRRQPLATLPAIAFEITK